MSISLRNVQSLLVSALGALVLSSMFISAAVGPASSLMI